MKIKKSYLKSLILEIITEYYEEIKPGKYNEIKPEDKPIFRVRCTTKNSLAKQGAEYNVYKEKNGLYLLVVKGHESWIVKNWFSKI